MGCFLGCFGGEKENKRRRHKINRASPQRQRNRVQNVHQEKLITAEQSVTETTHIDLVSELGCKPEGVEQQNPSPKRVEQQNPSPKRVEQLTASPKKRVTFNSNITTYEHVSVQESIESLPECNSNEKEKQDNLRTSSHSYSISEDDNSVTSSVGSYPPNHRYHNARESDDEAEEYGDSDLDDLDDLDDEDEDDYYDEDIDARISSQEVWAESVITASMESRTGNLSPQATTQEVESPMVKTQLLDGESKIFGSKTNARDRSGYINSVLNPVENITQWKAVKSKGTHVVKPQKENFANFEAPPCGFKTKSHPSKNANQEIAVDASLSNWLGSPDITTASKKVFSGFETAASDGSTTPVRSFEDRPILGALTVEELRQFSASPSPRKSPSRSPDEMPIIGTVGTYWNHSGSTKRSGSGSASSFKGIPNTTSKYREDKRVNWHSTPFETRLDRALKRGAVEDQFP